MTFYISQNIINWKNTLFKGAEVPDKLRTKSNYTKWRILPILIFTIKCCVNPSSLRNRCWYGIKYGRLLLREYSDRKWRDLEKAGRTVRLQWKSNTEWRKEAGRLSGRDLGWTWRATKHISWPPHMYQYFSPNISISTIFLSPFRVPFYYNCQISHLWLFQCFIKFRCCKTAF